MIDCELNLEMKVEIHDCSTSYEFDVIIQLFHKQFNKFVDNIALLVIIDINVISAIPF